jgi:nucleoid DNA-binding protein
MNNLGDIIIRLLYDNECVIVPDFGGFIAQYSSANLDDSTGFFSPPSKNILFNKNLINNDGLLVNTVAQLDDISFVDASAIIKSKVTQLKKELSEKKQIEIPSLGLIYLHQDIIKFKQKSENILLESYGLSSFNINEFKIPIFKESKVIKLDRPRIPISKNWWVAAAVIPLLFYSAWIPMKTNLFSEKESFHYSDLNPFTFTKQSKYHPKNLINIIGETKLSENEIEISSKPIGLSVQLNNIEKTEILTNIDKRSDILFHVIVGCFSNKANAQKLIKDLNNKGNKAHELDVHKNLHRISIGTFNNKKQAVRFKRKIKSQQNISSWVLKK